MSKLVFSDTENTWVKIEYLDLETDKSQKKNLNEKVGNTFKHSEHM